MKEQLVNMTIIELVKKSHEAASQPLDYYVTPVIITELASRLEALNLAYIGAMNNLRSATSAIDKMGTEGAYLLNGAAAELNGSWVRHKTVLGAQAALLCIMQGDISRAREWLEGTVDEVGADMPDDMTVAGLQEWFDSQMVAIDGRSGFLTRREAEDAIRARIPATDAWQREQIKKAIPEGYALVPQEMCLSAEAMEAICFHCGDGGFAFGEFTDGVLFVGDSEPEEGKKVHGLHIVTADYPEEGCAVICEFLPVLRNGVIV